MSQYFIGVAIYSDYYKEFSVFSVVKRNNDKTYTVIEDGKDFNKVKIYKIVETLQKKYNARVFYETKRF